jgi:hypothetical protein
MGGEGGQPGAAKCVGGEGGRPRRAKGGKGHH